jgi:hypothetical protein
MRHASHAGWKSGCVLCARRTRPAREGSVEAVDRARLGDRRHVPCRGGPARRRRTCRRGTRRRESSAGHRGGPPRRGRRRRQGGRPPEVRHTRSLIQPHDQSHGLLAIRTHPSWSTCSSAVRRATHGLSRSGQESATARKVRRGPPHVSPTLREVELVYSPQPESTARHRQGGAAMSQPARGRRER